MSYSQDAVKAARQDNGASLEGFHLDLPSTSERIRMSCGDAISSLCIAPVGGETAGIAAGAQFRPKGSW